MPARLGPDDESLFTTPRAHLLHEISGILPEPSGGHVRLDLHAGVRSIQRLALGDVGGTVVAGLWPAELKPQARYLYADGRAVALVAAARAHSWTVEAAPHLAFHTSPPARRLYLDPQVGVDEYVQRWEGADGGWIGRYPAEEVKVVLWPWLKERSYASAADGEALDRFLELLGRRGADLRPGLRLMRRWETDAARARSRTHELAGAIRRAVNAVLEAAREPALPATE